MVSSMTQTQAGTPLRPTGRNGRPIRQNGTAIRSLRMKGGWRTQAAFAEAVGISQQFLSAIEVEADGAPDDLLEAIAACLKVPVAAISRDTAGPQAGRNGTPILQNGPAIRALRNMDNWESQTAFARAVGISQPAMSVIEQEINSTTDSLLEAIARKLHVPVDAISRDIPAAQETAAEPAEPAA